MMEQKKTRRRPNFFDVLFILLILAVAGAAYLLSHRDSGVQAQTVRRTYVVELENLQEGMEDYVSVGDPVTDNVKNYDVGTVTSVEAGPYITSALDEETGIIRQVPVAGQLSLQLTIEVDTTEDAANIKTASGYILKTGDSVSLTAGQLSAAGYVLSVQR